MQPECQMHAPGANTGPSQKMLDRLSIDDKVQRGDSHANTAPPSISFVLLSATINSSLYGLYPWAVTLIPDIEWQSVSDIWYKTKPKQT